MNETRLYLASQGYLENVDVAQRIWALVAVFFVLAIMIAGHWWLKRVKRKKAEENRRSREYKKRTVTKQL